MHRKVSLQFLEGLAHRCPSRNVVTNTFHCRDRCLTTNSLYSSTPNGLWCLSNIRYSSKLSGTGQLKDGPSLQDFIAKSASDQSKASIDSDIAPYLTQDSYKGLGRKGMYV